MKTALLAAALLFSCTFSGAAQSRAKISDTTIDGKTRQEILQVEKKLAEAIEAHDDVQLGSMLADYFADALNESETATNKAGAIGSCKAGTLHSYRFGDSARLSRSGEMVTIEGVAQASEDTSTDNQSEERLFRVRRIWTQKEGHWLLVAQMRQPLEQEGAEEGKRPHLID